MVFSKHSNEELLNSHEKNIQKIKRDFTLALGRESIGGNAGSGAAAVNFTFNPDTGEIEQFTNNPEKLHNPRFVIGTVIVENVPKNPKVKVVLGKISEDRKILLEEAFNKHLKEFGRQFSN